MDFERLDVWKLSARLSVDVYRELAGCRDFGFKDQITRSALSVPSNIAEGMTRDGDKEKRYFLSMAKGSCSELRTQIYIGVEVGFISTEIGRNWIDRCKRIAAMLSGLLRLLQRP
ncbi:four helix bundle protein [Pseudomonas fluvialis]|jgi:four helix bundle protein|uniref:Four helix bundle protein n=1 Tax=Pseudomonas fluvialis TaxID=1793966 RepID=A0A2I0CLR7_9PSED|nr:MULTISPECIES: four helix bundle protein [Pseudomonas]MBP8262734.1 four helix bundle protein [Pseudomonas sp.]OXM40459.1 four helix bundle protein [Pseudomonas fluvialis]PKF70096.1 four helix bundle protein [Pseudomonas pharmacofabricae]GGH89484.1 four helix bundle protein [Pseudomonas fluvialis]